MPICHDCLYQKDNNPKHMSKSTQKWFHAHRIKSLTWTSQSLDLNPIKNLWDELKRVHLRDSALWCAAMLVGEVTQNIKCSGDNNCDMLLFFLITKSVNNSGTNYTVYSAPDQMTRYKLGLLKTWQLYV